MRKFRLTTGGDDRKGRQSPRGRFVSMSTPIRLSIAALLFAGWAMAPSTAPAQSQPAWDTPVPAQFQESWKAFLAMKAKAKPHEGPAADWSGLWSHQGALSF